jgi:hypothetical protein
MLQVVAVGKRIQLALIRGSSTSGGPSGAHLDGANCGGSLRGCGCAWHKLASDRLQEFFISPSTYFIRACSQKTRRWDAVLSAARASGSWEAQLAPIQTRLFKLFPEGGRVLLGSVAWRHLAYSRRHGGNWRIIPRRRR